MPSRKDNPDARLTIGYSSYRLPRSGLVQQVFLRQHLTGAKVSPIWSERAGRNQEVIETAERAASRGHAGCYRTGQPFGIYRTVLSRRSA